MKNLSSYNQDLSVPRKKDVNAKQDKITVNGIVQGDGAGNLSAVETVNADLLDLNPAAVGLGNVDNVKQYSASNPPPYPVTSVNGKTGAVTISALPTVTTADNGKFLRVVNGVWAADAAFVKADTQATYVPVSVGAPTSVNHATTKEYVDGKTGAIQASALLKSGGTMVGKLKLTAEPTEDNDAVDKAYVDAILPAFTAADNDKVLGIVNGALAWVAKA